MWIPLLRSSIFPAAPRLPHLRCYVFLQMQLKDEEEMSVRGGMIAKLCTSLCHTATAFQHEANDLESAFMSCENAEKLLEDLKDVCKQVPIAPSMSHPFANVFDDNGIEDAKMQEACPSSLSEELIVIQLDLLYRQLEVAETMYFFCLLFSNQ